MSISHAEANILEVLACYLVPALREPVHIQDLQPSTTGKLVEEANELHHAYCTVWENNSLGSE